MTELNFQKINQYICNENKISEGKEVTVYRYFDKVIKIFHSERKTTLKRISHEGLEKLSTLPLQCFNVPIDFILDNGEIVGYTEKYLIEEENSNSIDFDAIKNDIMILSENGFCMEDIFYNYMFTGGRLCFYDLTCFSYIDTEEIYLKRYFLKKNIELINIFFIGYLLFDAFQKGQSNEYTKIYLANQYRLEHCSNLFYGDLLKEQDNKRKILINTRINSKKIV